MVLDAIFSILVGALVLSLIAAFCVLLTWYVSLQILIVVSLFVVSSWIIGDIIRD